MRLLKLETKPHDFTIDWKFVPQDVWVGVYWRREGPRSWANGGCLTMFVCVLPLIPFEICLHRCRFYLEDY